MIKAGFLIFAVSASTHVLAHPGHGDLIGHNHSFAAIVVGGVLATSAIALRVYLRNRRQRRVSVSSSSD